MFLGQQNCIWGSLLTPKVQGALRGQPQISSTKIVRYASVIKNPPHRLVEPQYGSKATTGWARHSQARYIEFYSSQF